MCRAGQKQGLKFLVHKEITLVKKTDFKGKVAPKEINDIVLINF